MPYDKVLQVAILIWGCAFCAIAALCMFLSSNYDREKRRYLILMESFGQCGGPYFEFSRIPFK